MILDPAEISRLTAAPNMQNIYVAGNPFTRTHAGTYRAAIFNYFRETPGFTEDITIDGTLPGMVERRHLIDRVFEKPPPPPNLHRLQSPPPLTHSRIGDGDVSSLLVDPQTGNRNPRKKKAYKQRVVSLDESTKDVQEDMQTTNTMSATVERGSVGGDEYRRRLEALREEAGTGWLRVLSESGGLAENGGIQDNVGKT